MVVGLVLMVCGLGMMGTGAWLLFGPRRPSTDTQLAAAVAGLDRGLATVEAQRRRRSPAPWADWAVR